MYYTYEHYCLHLLNCTWFKCIKRYIEDLSNGSFQIDDLFTIVHNRFMGLDNLLDVVVHHFLIGKMIGLDYQDEFLIVNTLVCMVTHWTWSTMSHDLRLSSSHDLTKLLHCVISQPWENIKFMLKLAMTLTYRWDR